MTEKARKQPIREIRVKLIALTAESLFSKKGFDGTSIQEIADKAGIPKANVYYYFKTKEALYRTVLEDVLKEWIQDAEIFETDDDPSTVLTTYVTKKMQHSFDRPLGSRIWALEIITGGPIMSKEIEDTLIIWQQKVILKIRYWIDEGLIPNIEPQNLLNLIWSATQYYADYEYQINVLNRNKPLSKLQRRTATSDTVKMVVAACTVKR